TGLAVGVDKQYTFAGNAVDVGGCTTHQTTVVSADVEHSNIIGHDRQNVWEAPARLSLNRLLSLRRPERPPGAPGRNSRKRSAAQQDAAAIQLTRLYLYLSLRFLDAHAFLHCLSLADPSQAPTVGHTLIVPQSEV